MMNAITRRLWDRAAQDKTGDSWQSQVDFLQRFTELVVEETLRQVDERTYGRGENQWYYDDDKRWVRLHFGYGELSK
jgi:hypothetical protein